MFLIYLIITFVLISYARKDMYKYISGTPLVLFILDSGFTFFPSGSALTYLKAFVTILPILLYWRTILYNIKRNKWIVVFILYTLFLLLLSEEILVSSKNLIKAVPPLLYFYIGYSFFKSEKGFATYLKTFYFFLFLVIILGSIGYIFNFGRSFIYGGGDLGIVGLLQGGNYYPVAIIITILFALIQTNIYRTSRKIKILTIILMTATYVFILLTMRRTAIVLPIIGILTFLVLNPNLIRKSLVYFFSILLILVLSSTLFIDTLMFRYDVRAERGRFDKNFYETEARYVEILRVSEEVLSFTDLKKSLFGYNVFAGGMFSDKKQRVDHTDIAQILGTTGILGALLYILIYSSFLRLFFQNSKLGNLLPEIRYLNALFIAVLIVGLFVMLNGSIYIVTFRVTMFLALGALSGRIQLLRDQLTLKNK